MMNRQTFDSNGRLVEVYTNNGDGTVTVAMYDPDTGDVIGVTGYAGQEVVPVYPPLDTTGVVVTLLVVEGVITLVAGAAALHVDPEHLEHEAIAWAVASAVS
jgi:hypothetical protein